MDQIVQHPFINDITDKLTDLDVESYYKDLASSKNYIKIIEEADTKDCTCVLFSTKGKDNWNTLFSQLISAEEGEDVKSSQLVESYRNLTMTTSESAMS